MRILLLSLSALLLTACSGSKPYPDLPDKNFGVKTVSDSGAMLENGEASLDIYAVNADCATLYKGTLQLNQPVVEFGLPPKQQSYLVFTFNTSGQNSGSGNTVQGAFLTPKTAYRYMAEVSYVDTIYKVKVFEMNPAGRQSRQLELKDLSGCKNN
ncbi:MAG TPA: hypothetical protein VFX02_00465 [Gammaproteobacteria bacterium]|nr:hypothetical protein [Gammaproteobacteria bacterium]